MTGWMVAFVTVFVGLHAIGVLLARRVAVATPGPGRIRLTRGVAWTRLGCAIWFLGLFLITGTIIVAESPTLVPLQVLVVYGCVFGILAYSAQTAEWFRLASVERRASATVNELILVGHALHPAVVVKLPQSALSGILSGRVLTAEEINAIRGAL